MNYEASKDSGPVEISCETSKQGTILGVETRLSCHRPFRSGCLEISLIPSVRTGWDSSVSRSMKKLE